MSCLLLASLEFISIHAPPRGATWLTSTASTAGRFQFTPLREGRRAGATATYQRDVFQFTPLREGRRGGGGVKKSDERISIHAPPRGATCCGGGNRDGVRFQFTPLREGRRCIVHREGAGIVFQFTPLREGRLRFAPRIIQALISIHAPPRGATRGHDGYLVA